MSRIYNSVVGSVKNILPKALKKRTPEKETVNDELIEAWKAVFKVVDTNVDGFIDKEDLYFAYEDLLDKTPDTKVVDRVFASFDQDNDGQINLEEFLNWMKDREKKMDKYSKVFLDIDKNGDGKIDINELREAIRDVDPTASEEKVQRIMDALDKDNSGQIDYQEFIEGCL
eukprot:augustus_masked-scaffold_15-processed-gene-5.43-mRNA-1 protein AED:0.32 eAED:0.33 QI:0/-1/0/1/-1/1/1/0/170